MRRLRFQPSRKGKYRWQWPLLFQPAEKPYISHAHTNDQGVTIRRPDVRVRFDGRAGSVATLATHGPTADTICGVSQWPWERAGGDFTDADGVRHGPRPWAQSMALASPSGPGVLEIDVTEALRYIRSNGLHCALLLKQIAGGTTTITVNGCKGPLPSATLEFHRSGGPDIVGAWCTAALQTGGATTAMDDTMEAGGAVNLVVEFFPPADESAPFDKATLRWPHQGTAWGSGITLGVYVITPRIPDLTPLPGLAAAYPFDAEIKSHPDVLLSFTVLDGDTTEDHIDTARSGMEGRDWYGAPAFVPRVHEEGNFLPQLWFADAPPLSEAEKNKLQPRASFGKFVGTGSHEYLRVIGSDDAEAISHGFRPLFPGAGALEYKMPARDIKPGQMIVSSLERGIDQRAYFSEDEFGRVNRCFLRFYLLLGDGFDACDDDIRINPVIAADGTEVGKIGKYLEDIGIDPLSYGQWRGSSHGGKFFGGFDMSASAYAVVYNYPTRERQDGTPDDSTSIARLCDGYSNSSGRYGYSLRLRFSKGYHREGDPGPCVGGITIGAHLYDFSASSMIIPSQGGISLWDADWRGAATKYGGMGYLRKGHYYCIDLEWRQNTLKPYTLPPRGTRYGEGGANIDGYLRWHIDGVLAGESPTFATRANPMLDWMLQASSGHPWPQKDTMRMPTNVPPENWGGIGGVVVDIFYGGKTYIPRDAYFWVNGLVAAKSHVGPMGGVSREHGGLGN